MTRTSLVIGLIAMAGLSSCKKDEVEPVIPTACFALEKTSFVSNEWIVLRNCSVDADFVAVWALDTDATIETSEAVLNQPAEVDSFRIGSPGVYRILLQAYNSTPGSPIEEYMVPVLIEE